MAHRASMIASSPAVPEQKHVLSPVSPSTVNPLLAVHEGHSSSPFTAQHPPTPGLEPSSHTYEYALAESIRDDAHAMSAKHRKKRGVFVNAPPLDDRSMVLANIIRVFSLASYF